MSKFKFFAPAVLVILFEIAVGLMLLIDPVGFTNSVVIILGILFLVLCVICLISFIRAKKNEESGTLSLIGAIVLLIIGVVFTFFSQAILTLIVALSLIYGIILFVFGINKIVYFFAAKNQDMTASWLNLLGGILALILGVVIVIYPKDATEVLWTIAGIAMLLEAVIDIITVIHTASLMKKVNF